jgi:predicted ferric reductase
LAEQTTLYVQRSSNKPQSKWSNDMTVPFDPNRRLPIYYFCPKAYVKQLEAMLTEKGVDIASLQSEGNYKRVGLEA